jgi:hypothetical protein
MICGGKASGEALVTARRTPPKAFPAKEQRKTPLLLTMLSRSSTPQPPLPVKVHSSAAWKGERPEPPLFAKVVRWAVMRPVPPLPALSRTIESVSVRSAPPSVATPFTPPVIVTWRTTAPAVNGGPTSSVCGAPCPSMMVSSAPAPTMVTLWPTVCSAPGHVPGPTQMVSSSADASIAAWMVG